MADLKISQLTDGETVQVTDQIPVNRAGSSRRVVVGSLATQDGTFSGTHSGDSSGTNTGDQTTVSGNAGTATKLATARNINGVAFDGSANITVPAAAGTLTGATLASGVTASSLLSAAGGSFGTAAFVATSAFDAAGAAAAAQAASQPADAALTALAAGSDFVQFTGPTTSIKQFTLPNAAAVILTDNAVVTGAQGGTGVANTGKTLTLGGSVTITGAFTLGLTVSANTSLTLPTTGTLATLAGAETFTNKSIDAGQLTGSIAAARLPAFTGPVTTSAGAIATTMVFEKQVVCSDSTTSITTGAKKARFCWPFTGTLTEVIIDVDVAPTGSTIIVNVKKNGTTIFSTKVTIDASETSSLTAATPAVISVAGFTKGDIFTIDFDQVGSSTAGTNLIITFNGTRS